MGTVFLGEFVELYSEFGGENVCFQEKKKKHVVDWPSLV